MLNSLKEKCIIIVRVIFGSSIKSYALLIGTWYSVLMIFLFVGISLEKYWVNAVIGGSQKRLLPRSFSHLGMTPNVTESGGKGKNGESVLRHPKVSQI
jgi:hypothetical protein